MEPNLCNSLVFCLDETEKKRFGRYIVPERTIDYYHENFHSLTKLIHQKPVDNVFIFGQRPPDVSALKMSMGFSKNIFVIQHAKNPIRKSHNLGYFLANRKKLTQWILSMMAYRLKHYSVSNKISTNLFVYYFTDEYRESWKRIIKHSKVEFIACGPPDETRFGTIDDIPVAKKSVKFFLIDEPFQSTLGINDVREQQLIKDLLFTINSKEKIFVKLHPRSNKNKYSRFPQFSCVDEIFVNCENLIGYRSGLLDYPFNNKYLIKLEELNWNKVETLAQKPHQASYIDDVTNHLRDKL